MKKSSHSTSLPLCMPLDLQVHILSEWVCFEDFPALKQMIGAEDFLRIVSSPGFRIEATKILSDDTVAWLAEHQVPVKLLECVVEDTFDGHIRTQWFLNGKLHRGDDLPAVVLDRGYYEEWWQHGKPYRECDKPTTECKSGLREWRNDRNQLHRDNDLPAWVTHEDQRWYQYGNLHRDGDLPAWVSTHTGHRWYQHGCLHRDGGLPAVIMPNGDRGWFQHGKQHREGDLPAVDTEERKHWYKHDKSHRGGDQPAVIYTNGKLEWHFEGELHRDDGPAIVYPNGSELWYRHDQEVPPLRRSKRAKKI